MTAWAGPGSSAAEVMGPRPGTLESRASLALRILAGVNAAGIILAFIPGKIPSSVLQTVAFHVASGALAVLYLVVARALGRRQHWAVSAIRPLLLVLLVWGAYTLVTTIAVGAFRIPFTALAASWALLGPSDRRPLPRLRGRGGAVLVVSAALIAMVLVGPPAFGWGGFFDVHGRDLSASLAVDCGTPGVALPERIAIAYTWSWSGNTLLANEDDVVVIGWNGDDGEGHPLYVLGDTPEAGKGISMGTTSGVSATMAEQAEGDWRGSMHWVIDLSVRGIRAGRVELVLMRAKDQPPEPEPLTVGTSYIHVGVWRHDVSAVTCSW
ncbi:MAG: hypothetical protein ACXWMB_01665 [Candidatus Limnocylindria bacterium]